MAAPRPTRRQVLESSLAVAVVPGLLVGCAEEGALDDLIAPGDDTGLPTDTDEPTDSGDTDEPEPEPEPPVETPFDVGALPEDLSAFPWAVQAGAMRTEGTTSRAVLVTRVSELLDAVGVRVWRPASGPGQVFLDIDDVVAVSPDSAGFLRVEVTGLAPGVEHSYAWFTIDRNGGLIGRSTVGRLRTPPTDDVAAPFTVALCACNGGARGRNDAFGRLADHTIDAIVHVGDIVYADGARSLQEYRDSWRQWMTSEGYRAGFAAAGVYATWDDHEVDNNWDPEEVSSAQRAAAFQAFVESLAVEPGADGRLWQSYRWGATAELLVLDCRGERLPSSRGGSNPQYVSEAQLDWLVERLEQSDARFKVVLNSVPITNMPGLWDFAADDRWEGYPTQRNRVLDAIRALSRPDVVFLSGDFHVCFVGKVQPGGTGALAETYEIAATSGNSNPLGELLRRPQFQYGTSQARTVLVTFDPTAGTVTTRFLDPVDGTEDAVIVLGGTP